jgi:hypothetical protein
MTHHTRGGESNGTPGGIAIGNSGDAYITGSWTGGGLPVTAGALQKVNKGTAATSSAFVAELDPSGSTPVYCTYLGGSRLVGDNNVSPDGDYGTAIAVDSAGQAYVTGYTNFPTSRSPPALSRRPMWAASMPHLRS